ncbi:MAG TPA: hypothetical protein VFL34_16470, partial [Candidatus Sulfotelmatobacter sp.]|nr:hypothetical protein [Candidatus Sulfotelmatobacter sp.]
VREAEHDSRFRRRAAESVKRIAAFKRKSSALRSRVPSSPPEKISRLATQLWEFSERVRYSALSSAAAAGKKS